MKRTLNTLCTAEFIFLNWRAQMNGNKSISMDTLQYVIHCSWSLWVSEDIFHTFFACFRSLKHRAVTFVQKKYFSIYSHWCIKGAQWLPATPFQICKNSKRWDVTYDVRVTMTNLGLAHDISLTVTLDTGAPFPSSIIVIYDFISLVCIRSVQHHESNKRFHMTKGSSLGQFYIWKNE